MATNDELLALADELEGMDVREGCRSCPADGTKDCRGDLSCEEAVARAAARRIRETVERPAVLAADGEPLEVGQTVWNVNNGMEFTVSSLPKPGEYQAVEVRYRNGSSTSFDPDQLTHERPVLDADGVPIKVGDTVWDTETGCGRTVRAVNDNETVEFDGYENRGWFGKFLTHAKPDLDTWERIEEDATRMPGEYCERYGIYGDSFPQAEAMACDLVRRCRALAERGEL